MDTVFFFSLGVLLAGMIVIYFLHALGARLLRQRVLARSTHWVLALLGLAFILLVLPGAKQIGASLLASAGVAGLVAGMAARPVVGNFIAGLQLAFTNGFNRAKEGV